MMWYGKTYKNTNKSAWFMLKSNFLWHFKPIYYDRWNCQALDHYYQWSPNLQEYITAYLKLLLYCKTYVIEKKHWFVFKLVYRMKLRLNFWCSSPLTWKLYVKLPIGLVASCSTHQAMEVTNTKAKADIVTKILKITQIASIYHTSNGKNHRTQKDQVLWN